VTNINQNALVILRRRQLEGRTGLSRSTIYDRLDPKSPRYDPLFPRPIKLGGSAIGFVESEVDAWIAIQIKERDALNLESIDHMHARVASLSTTPTTNDGKSEAIRTIANHQSRGLKIMVEKD
jgi:prophage regulatory protein